MAVGAVHLAIIGMNAGRANGMGEATHSFRRKKPVRADPHKAEARTNSPKGLEGRRLTMQRVPDVHGPQDGQVGVGVKALDEPVTLVVEVAGNVKAATRQAASGAVHGPWVFAVSVRLAAITLIEQLGGLIAEHADLPGERQPAPRRPLRSEEHTSEL